LKPVPLQPVEQLIAVVIGAAILPSLVTMNLFGSDWSGVNGDAFGRPLPNSWRGPILILATGIADADRGNSNLIALICPAVCAGIAIRRAASLPEGLCTKFGHNPDRALDPVTNNRTLTAALPAIVARDRAYPNLWHNRCFGIPSQARQAILGTQLTIGKVEL